MASPCTIFGCILPRQGFKGYQLRQTFKLQSRVDRLDAPTTVLHESAPSSSSALPERGFRCCQDAASNFEFAFPVQMDQMLQSPAIQQLLGSPGMQQMAQNPAFAQFAGSMLGPQGAGGPGGNGMPDLASMMQSLVPGMAEVGCCSAF